MLEFCRGVIFVQSLSNVVTKSTSLDGTSRSVQFITEIFPVFFIWLPKHSNIMVLLVKRYEYSNCKILLFLRPII